MFGHPEGVNMVEWHDPLCPMCGRNMGMRTILNVPGKPQFGIERKVNLWEKRAEYSGDEIFGVVKSSEGKGTLKMVRYYDIDEDTDGYFSFMKQRLLKILIIWLAKGWLTKDELDKL